MTVHTQAKIFFIFLEMPLPCEVQPVEHTPIAPTFCQHWVVVVVSSGGCGHGAGNAAADTVARDVMGPANNRIRMRIQNPSHP